MAERDTILDIYVQTNELRSYLEEKGIADDVSFSTKKDDHITEAIKVLIDCAINDDSEIVALKKIRQKLEQLDEGKDPS